MSQHKFLSYAAVYEMTPMSWHLLRLPRLRGLGAALASRPFC
jgi:hypothetical protein